jgi:putative ABC transport system permease protein
VFARHLGFSDPQAAIGRIIYYRRVQTAGAPGLPVRIIGVVESRPLHFTGDGVTGSAYFLSEQNRQMIIRLSRDDVSGGLKAIKALWTRLVPGVPFKYDFMDTLFDEGYAVFGNVSQAFTGLALFAFLISAIGLFGMGSHVASRRRREIGVRKTLGASTRQIAVMLLTDFSKPVIVANLIAWPVAYLAANAYLNVFIHRIALSPAPFALSLAVTVLIAWAAVGTQAFRAARVKPSIVLRYE